MFKVLKRKLEDIIPILEEPAIFLGSLYLILRIEGKGKFAIKR